jgi:hypothetical protein
LQGLPARPHLLRSDAQGVPKYLDLATSFNKKADPKSESPFQRIKANRLPLPAGMGARDGKLPQVLNTHEKLWVGWIHLADCDDQILGFSDADGNRTGALSDPHSTADYLERESVRSKEAKFRFQR